jgi:hypothetical protein
MEKLDNGKYLVNGIEVDGTEYSNISLGECGCGWRYIDNQFTVYLAFQDHECLTKAGKPRKKKLDGRMRAATFDEVWLDDQEKEKV